MKLRPRTWIWKNVPTLLRTNNSKVPLLFALACHYLHKPPCSMSSKCSSLIALVRFFGESCINHSDHIGRWVGCGVWDWFAHDEEHFRRCIIQDFGLARCLRWKSENDFGRREGQGVRNTTFCFINVDISLSSFLYQYLILYHPLKSFSTERRRVHQHKLITLWYRSPNWQNVQRHSRWHLVCQKEKWISSSSRGCLKLERGEIEVEKSWNHEQVSKNRMRERVVFLKG